MTKPTATLKECIVLVKRGEEGGGGVEEKERRERRKGRREPGQTLGGASLLFSS